LEELVFYLFDKDSASCDTRKTNFDGVIKASL